MDPRADQTAKAVLHRQLQLGRDALRWKVQGLDEFDLRRPLTPTGTNLLGLVKHVAGVVAEYFGVVFDRPFPDPPGWLAEDAPRNADMYATADESRAQVLAFWDAAWQHADVTIGDLDPLATGTVPWWPPDRRHVTVLDVLAHVVAELHRHVGHADIVRELVDGAAGLRASHSNLPDGGAGWWEGHLAAVTAAVDAHRDRMDPLFLAR